MFIEFTENYAVEASRICGLSRLKGYGYDDTIEAFLEMGSHAKPVQRTIFTYESEEERDRVYNKILYELGTVRAHVKPIDMGVLNTFDGGSAKFADEADAEVDSDFICFQGTDAFLPEEIECVVVDLNRGLTLTLTVHFKDELGSPPRYFTYSRVLIDDVEKVSFILGKLESSGVTIHKPLGFCV